MGLLDCSRRSMRCGHYLVIHIGRRHPAHRGNWRTTATGRSNALTTANRERNAFKPRRVFYDKPKPPGPGRENRLNKCGDAAEGAVGKFG